MANKIRYLTILAFIRFPLDLNKVRNLYRDACVVLLKRYNLYPILIGLIATIIPEPKYTEARKSPQDHSAPQSPIAVSTARCTE